MKDVQESDAKDWFRYGINARRREEIHQELSITFFDKKDWKLILGSYYQEIYNYTYSK